MNDGYSDAGNRNFAANVGIEFKTPEEYFLHESPQPFTRDFDPSVYLRSAFSTSLDAGTLVIEKKNALDIVLLYNTNADGETRAAWVQLAQKFNVPIRCVHFTASSKLCEHNDTVRAIAGGDFNPDKRTILPHSAFSSFASRFKQPKTEEGFQDLVAVEFQVDRASAVASCRLTYFLQVEGDVEQRKTWCQYWI
ncbi:MAG: hypothetical protein Q9216_005547 [Gyalolechia sp. 2 TL-2023]